MEELWVVGEPHVTNPAGGAHSTPPDSIDGVCCLLSKPSIIIFIYKLLETWKNTLSLSLSLSLHLNGHYPGGPRVAGSRMFLLWILLELRMMEVVSGNNWSYKTRKAPVKSSPPTNQHPTFYRPDAIPFAQNYSHYRQLSVS